MVQNGLGNRTFVVLNRTQRVGKSLIEPFPHVVDALIRDGVWVYWVSLLPLKKP